MPHHTAHPFSMPPELGPAQPVEEARSVTNEAFVWDAPPNRRPPSKTHLAMLGRIAELEARVAQLEAERLPAWAPPVIALLEDAHARYSQWRPRRGWRSRLADLAERLATHALHAAITNRVA